MLPVSDSSIATGRVASIFANTIISIAVIGTARNMPTTPHMAPQTKSDRITRDLLGGEHPPDLGHKTRQLLREGAMLRCSFCEVQQLLCVRSTFTWFL